MTFSDLREFCRLCFLPLNGTYVDCGNDDNAELKDTIKMVYNIDINSFDEYSTKVCLMCCDILLCNTIHYVRTVEVQKSLTRIQRIKNKLRNFGKKKVTEKKEQKPATAMVATTAVAASSTLSSLVQHDGTAIVDVEMVEIEPNYSKTVFLDDCEMKDPNEHNEMALSYTLPHVEPHQQMLFAHLTTFNPSQMSTNNNIAPIHSNKPNHFDWWIDENPVNDYLIVPPAKPGIIRENNSNGNCMRSNSSSLFQRAKRLCGNFVNKHKSTATAAASVNVEHGMDEITKQMALLQFASC